MVEENPFTLWTNPHPSLRGQPLNNTLRSWLDYHGGVEDVLESAGPRRVALRWDSEMFEDPEICKCVAGC